MTIFIAFLLGIAFVQWGIPLLDGILGVFLTWLEVHKGRLAVKITESSVNATKLKKELEEDETSSSRAIGFVIPEEEEEEYDDEIL